MIMKEIVQFTFTPALDEGFEELYEHAEVIKNPLNGKPFGIDQLKHFNKDATILTTEFSQNITPEVIDYFPNLKLISNYAVGFNNIDVAYANSKGITVTNTPKAVVQPTAELTIALLMSLTRRVAEWDRKMRAERTNNKKGIGDLMGVDLYGKKAGIIGYGNIGQAVGKVLKALGMEIYYNKRTRLSEHEEQELSATYATREEIFKTCDVICLHTPLTPETQHLINAETLEMMKESAILVNVARGAVADEAALVEALQTRKIAGAALDVFEDHDQPLSALYDLDNVVMTPHIGTQTRDARIAMAREQSNNILGFLLKDREISEVKV